MKKIAMTLIVLLLFTNIVYPHPGRTNSEGCHTCRTNCQDYNLETDQYHCHNGESTTSIETSLTTTSKKTTTSKEETTSTTSITSSLPSSTILISFEQRNDGKIRIEKDLYNGESGEITIYESDDYKAKRMALYFFSFILILVITKLIVKK